MHTILFSDVHLDVAPEGKPRIQRLAQFLRSIDPAQTRRLVVLGDLFDFWFEYRHVIFSGYFDVLREFARLRDHGVELYFVCGNHDFWAGRFLRDELGFVISRGPLELAFGSRRGHLIHGDGIRPADYLYRAYKRIARNPIVVALFRLMHPDWAMAIAQRVSHGSRALARVDDVSQGPQVGPLQAYARAVLARGDADIVICGHSHCPALEEMPTPTGPGLYLNTGDWTHHYSYLAWDGESFKLFTAEK